MAEIPCIKNIGLPADQRCRTVSYPYVMKPAIPALIMLIL